MIKLTSGPSEDGSRLDRLLRKRLPLLGLSGIYGLIRRGAVRVDGKRVKQDHRLKDGEILEIDVDEAEFKSEERPQNSLADLVRTDFFKRNFKILYEDAQILVCNKPAGLVVHSGSGHSSRDNLVDLAAAYILSISKGTSAKKTHEPEIPTLMHRLDRDTSGVIMLSKNKGVLRTLHDDMRNGKFTKQYVAVCHNRPPEYEGTVTFGMKKNSGGRSGMKMNIDSNGTTSSTTYKLLGYQNDLSQLEILLHTGKTHQIRVHMSHLGAPVLGDGRYGDQRLDRAIFSSSTILPNRLYLHAHKLSFPHPKTRKSMTITAPTPTAFSLALEKGK